MVAQSFRLRLLGLVAAACGDGDDEAGGEEEPLDIVLIHTGAGALQESEAHYRALVDTAFDAIARLRDIYCSTTGHDYNHVFVPDERVWLRQAVESGQFRPPKDPIDGRELLERITEVETFERFLHRTFPGKTRFSIEGLDMMVPILDEIIHDAAEGGVQHVMIAMAHRGRLNVLAHIMQKPYSQVLA